MDTITLRDLEVSYHVGVPDEERAHPQRLLISVEMETDITQAAAGDDLETFTVQALADRGADTAHAAGHICNFLTH
jgi:FolB domain-containing protein